MSRLPTDWNRFSTQVPTRRPRGNPSRWNRMLVDENGELVNERGEYIGTPRSVWRFDVHHGRHGTQGLAAYRGAIEQPLSSILARHDGTILELDQDAYFQDQLESSFKQFELEWSYLHPVDHVAGQHGGPLPPKPIQDSAPVLQQEGGQDSTSASEVPKAPTTEKRGAVASTEGELSTKMDEEHPEKTK